MTCLGPYFALILGQVATKNVAGIDPLCLCCYITCTILRKHFQFRIPLRCPRKKELILRLEVELLWRSHRPSRPFCLYVSACWGKPHGSTGGLNNRRVEGIADACVRRKLKNQEESDNISHMPPRGGRRFTHASEGRSPKCRSVSHTSI